MNPLSLRRWLLLGLAVSACTITCADVGRCCPFCGPPGQTLTMDVKQASMVLYGTLQNAKLDPANDLGGTTDLVVEAVVKTDKLVEGKKVITLPRYVPPDPMNTAKYLVFCDVYKGKVDPYRGIAVPQQSDMVKYLQGALALDSKNASISERLRYFFDYLDNPDPEVTQDAFREFSNSDYKDYRDMAVKLPPDKVVKWLEDANTPAFRYGLYASMLGHCGTEKHAGVLKKMIDDPQKRMTSGIDGVLAGYTMLRPKEGWAVVRETLGDEKKEFMFRYAALRAVRFFWEWRSDVIKQEELVEATCLLLPQGDIADLAIEDLRKWGRAEVMDRVLSLYGKKSHDVPIVRRSILRYALTFPKEAKAAEFIKQRKKEDAEAVQDAEELLKLESSSKPAAPAASKGK